MNINRSFLEKCNFFNGLEILELTPEWVQSFTDSEGNFNYIIVNPKVVLFLSQFLKIFMITILCYH